LGGSNKVRPRLKVRVCFLKKIPHLLSTKLKITKHELQSECWWCFYCVCGHPSIYDCKTKCRAGIGCTFLKSFVQHAFKAKAKVHGRGKGDQPAPFPPSCTLFPSTHHISRPQSLIDCEAVNNPNHARLLKNPNKFIFIIGRKLKKQRKALGNKRAIHSVALMDKAALLPSFSLSLSLTSWIVFCRGESQKQQTYQNGILLGRIKLPLSHLEESKLPNPCDFFCRNQN